MQQDGRRYDQYASGPAGYGGGYEHDGYDNSYRNNNYNTNPDSHYNNNYAFTSTAGRHDTPPQYRDEEMVSEYGEEPFDLNAIDPELRLRSTRTAHSVIAESIRGEDVRERKRSRLFGIRRRTTRRKKEEAAAAAAADKPPPVPSSVYSDYSAPSVDGSTTGTTTSSPPPPSAASPPDDPSLVKKKVLPRRTVFVNMELPMDQVDKKGEPVVRYARNKVRTSKYTIVTFLPRNLFEQFHRVANIYFLGLVILQLFPMFGATTPEIAMLPLVAILGMTAIKDAVEDWRRAKLDEEVNTSAATKLTNWKNVNQPTDPRNWFERLFHLGPGE
jgi:phospholipid-translocating ATPase